MALHTFGTITRAVYSYIIFNKCKVYLKITVIQVLSMCPPGISNSLWTCAYVKCYKSIYWVFIVYWKLRLNSCFENRNTCRAQKFLGQCLMFCTHSFSKSWIRSCIVEIKLNTSLKTKTHPVYIRFEDFTKIVKVVHKKFYN